MIFRYAPAWAGIHLQPKTVVASASEAIHGAPGGGMDCFVAEFIIGPAEGGTRWLLAMTAESV
jgi:hypothetical protein